jgi:hypothetical protein
MATGFIDPFVLPAVSLPLLHARRTSGNDMVNMKPAHIDQLSGVCALFLVRQPYGLPLCRAEFLTGHRDPNLFN